MPLVRYFCFCFRVLPIDLLKDLAIDEMKSKVKKWLLTFSDNLCYNLPKIKYYWNGFSGIFFF